MSTPTCKRTGKVIYRSRVAATYALLRIDRRPRRLSTRNETRTYFCQACKGWHLTSKG